MSGKDLDIVLFGATGFTGKLAIQHILHKAYDVKFAICVRDIPKANSFLEKCNFQNTKPEILQADLVCDSQAKTERLKNILTRTKVAIPAAGPFEKYGKTLVKLCAELGVHYADITGESDFVRSMVDQYDSVARSTGAKIVCHCGNDCIPWDMTVLKMHEYALAKGCRLTEVDTWTELPPSATASGGTLSTALYQLGKDRSKVSKSRSDPLLRAADGSVSKYHTKITSPKSDVYVAEFKRSAGYWLMQPVMGNCIRRSNALNGYNDKLRFSEALLRPETWSHWLHDRAFSALFAGALYFPPLRGFLSQTGQGPSQAEMEAGWLKVHGRGVMVSADGRVT